MFVYRRRQFLLRKFGSNTEIPSEPELSEKTSRPEFGLRTLPNHYTSDHQLITDLHGRSVLSSASTLIIGGVPFHILQPCDVTRREEPSYGRTVYPVYETIQSDVSELSSVYSETGGTYTHMVGSREGAHALMSGSLREQDESTYVPVSGPYTPMQFLESRRDGDIQETNQCLGSRLDQGRLGPETSGYPRYPQFMINQSSLSALPVIHPSNHTANRALLRNLPSQRSQSFRTAPSSRGPLPAVPRLQLLQSTISLEHTPTSAPVTKL